MPVSSVDWVFGRQDATGRRDVTFLSNWRGNDPNDVAEQETQIVRCLGGDVATEFVDFHCVDVIELRDEKRRCLVVGLRGNTAVISDEDTKFGALDNSRNGPFVRGDVRGLARIEDDVFAYGMQRQVYRLNRDIGLQGEGKWDHFEDGISWQADEVAGFNCMDGYSVEELYAVGWKGEVQICDRGKWSDLEKVTNLKLETCVCSPDGFVYAFGLRGVVVFGRSDRWDAIKDIPEFSPWGSCVAFDRVWIAAREGIFSLRDKNLEMSELGLEEETVFRDLAYSNGRLWASGPNHVIWTEDGVRWNQVFF